MNRKLYTVGLRFYSVSFQGVPQLSGKLPLIIHSKSTLFEEILSFTVTQSYLIRIITSWMDPIIDCMDDSIRLKKGLERGITALLRQILKTCLVLWDTWLP